MKREEEIKQAAAYILEMYGEENEDSDVSEGFREGAKWADKTNANGKELLYVAQKTAERTRKEIISKACEWIKANINIYAEVVTNLKSPYSEIIMGNSFEKTSKKQWRNNYETLDSTRP
jgi:hypothetical protein